MSQQLSEVASYTAGLEKWIGRTEVQNDVAAEAPAALMAATLDRQFVPRAGDPLPCAWHWIYFLSTVRQSDLGEDGHARRGLFMPPVPLPRRMWGGSRIEFRHPLRIGEPIRRKATVADLQAKIGHAGPLVVVRVTYEIENSQGIAIVEERDIVYRNVATANAAAVPPEALDDAQWIRRHVVDSVLLFRYSALTFNSHRIHYDSGYATQTEGYPGLVVHGPLLATLLAESAAEQSPSRAVRRASFRAVSPVFCDEPFTVAGKSEGNRARLRVANAHNRIAMSADVEFA